MESPATAPIDVSVVVVTYEGRELLPDCLASIDAEAAAWGLSVETIVVDNCSSDGTVDWLRAQHPEVVAIAAPDNRGFAAGNNIGMRVAQGRCWLLMNNDARLGPGSLRAMVDALDREPDIGMLGPQLRNPDGTLQRSIRGFPTPWRLATEYLYIRKLGRRTRALNAFYAGGNDHSRRCDAEFLMGACMLVRPEAVAEVGAMDEGYFMYSEETDWAKRFHNAGWRVVFDPTARVTHLGGATSRKAWTKLFASQVTGHLRFLALHGTSGQAKRARQLLSLALGLRAVLYAGSPRGKTFAAGRRAVRSFDIDSVQPEVPALR